MDIYEKINENKTDIVDCEKNIEQLEKEIKELKKQGQSTYSQVLAKRLEINELEIEIIDIQSANDKLVKGEILKDLTERKDGKQVVEHRYLSDCYRKNNDVQRLMAIHEGLRIKLQIMTANKEQNTKAYQNLQEEIKANESEITIATKSLDASVQLYDRQGGRQGKNIDFSVPYTDILAEYEGNSSTIEEQANQMRNEPVSNRSDYGQLSSDLVDYTVGKYYKDRNIEREEIAENAKKQSIPIFSNGLDENSKQLAEVYGELYSDGLAEFVSGTKEPNYYEDLQKKVGTNLGISKIILLDSNPNRYGLVYQKENETQIGISCKKNPETGKLEVCEYSRWTTDGIMDLENEKFNQFCEGKPYITREQMEMQVVKHNIEKSIQDGTVSEIVEIKDPKMLQYLNQQNNLQQYYNIDITPKVYMISRQDKHGNSHYEFMSHNSSKGYTKLEGLQQVPNKQSSIIIDGTRVPGQPTPMQKVDCTFMDRNGNSYFAYHQFGEGMALAYGEHQKENADKVEVSKDSGLNRMLHNSRVSELMKAGYRALGVGYEKVKDVLSKYKSQEKEQTAEKAIDD